MSLRKPRSRLSVRVRLLVAVGAVTLLALIAADLATYYALRSSLYNRADQTLDQVASLPIGALERAAGVYVGIRYPDGSISYSHPAEQPDGTFLSPKLPGDLQAPPPRSGQATYLTEPSEGAGPPFRVRISTPNLALRPPGGGLVVPLPPGSQLIVAAPLTDTVATLHHLVWIELAVTFFALVAAGLLGWWLVRVGLRPLAEVEATAEAITAGDLDRRVPGDDASTEVGQLARALNTMLVRIQQAFAERDATEAELRRSEGLLRQFVADASHELRTPLSAVTAYAELFERGANEVPEDLDRVMSGIRSETARMGSLVEDLLLLARLDEGRPLERKPVELVSLAAEAVEAAVAVGPEWPIELRANRSVEAMGDSARLRQVVDNLLANVRAHTPPGTAAKVCVIEAAPDGASNSAVIEVSDNGPGLTDQQQRRVFERFYRADPSRSREHGGAGLGLGIVAAIVEAHGGTVAASSTPGGGATFTVRLPAEN